MTKAKIMLSAVAAIAAVGGAFALKSKKIGGTALYTLYKFEPLQAQQSCDKFLTGSGTLNPINTANRNYYYITVTAPVASPTDDYGYRGDACTYQYYTVIL